MRYGLRTLLILLALGPPVLAGAWWLRWLACPQRSEWHGLKGTARTQVMLLSDATKLYCLHTGELPADLQGLLIPPQNAS